MVFEELEVFFKSKMKGKLIFPVGATRKRLFLFLIQFLDFFCRGSIIKAEKQPRRSWLFWALWVKRGGAMVVMILIAFILSLGSVLLLVCGRRAIKFKRYDKGEYQQALVGLLFGLLFIAGGLFAIIKLCGTI